MHITFTTILKVIGLLVLLLLLFTMFRMFKTANDLQSSLEKSIIAPADKRKEINEMTFTYRKRKRLFKEIAWSAECEKQFDEAWKVKRFTPFAKITMYEISPNEFIVGIPCSTTAYNGFLSTYVYYDKNTVPPTKIDLQLDVYNYDTPGITTQTEYYSFTKYDNVTKEFTSSARSGAGCYFKSIYKYVNKSLELKEYRESGCTADNPFVEDESKWKVIYFNKNL